MPFKSQAQQRNMAMLVGEGKLSKRVYQEFADATGNVKRLPKHVKPNKRK